MDCGCRADNPTGVLLPMPYKKPSVPTVHFDTFFKGLPDLTGKTFAVTGTTSGTGRIAAKALAEKGGRVIMLNRTSSRSRRCNKRWTNGSQTVE